MNLAFEHLNSVSNGKESSLLSFPFDARGTLSDSFRDKNLKPYRANFGVARRDRTSHLMLVKVSVTGTNLVSFVMTVDTDKTPG